MFKSNISSSISQSTLAPWSLASVIFFSQSQSGSTQWSPSTGCHLAGCAPIKEMILGVNLAAAAQRERVWGAEPHSQSHARGLWSPSLLPTDRGLGQAARTRESRRWRKREWEKGFYQQTGAQLLCAVWELGELTLWIMNGWIGEEGWNTSIRPPPH